MILVKILEALEDKVNVEISGLADKIKNHSLEIDNGSYWLSSDDFLHVMNEFIHTDDLEIDYETSKVYLKKDLYENTLSENEIKEFKLAPFPHQWKAINYTLQEKEKWLLLDEMGAG